MVPILDISPRSYKSGASIHDVRAKGTLTFDWVFMLLVAAFVAAIGLIETPPLSFVASMLLSPLMVPLLNF
ncbi:unnamed protein product [Arctia plantaginis]|uniref:Uncharacterized protein n=1 Tax=Arctia plantaginis TaxID=874455 RepID=A0A8S1BM88_ARCPL|nr:unnamed protein product [Arctia plantaginis]